MQAIAETAERICVDVAQKGSSSSAEVFAKADAELAGLLKKLTDLGIHLEGKLDSKQFDGVLQEQLADSLKDVRSCKIHIFDKLEQKLVPQHSEPVKDSRDPDGLYQFGEKVAVIQGSIFDEANGKLTYAMLKPSGKANPAREFEYRDWVVNCPRIPAPPPNSLSGAYNGVSFGGNCEIMKKRQP